MGHKLAIDFGTTNSVIAHWNSDKGASEIVYVPNASAIGDDDLPSLIPSLLYVHDASNSKVTIGQAVRENRLDYRKDNRLFRNFKRWIVAMPAPDPREIDGALYGDQDAGRSFIRQMLAYIPYPKAEIEQLVLTAPVACFEGSLAWLNTLIEDIPAEKVRIVDVSTAAALGYAVTEPGALVLVFDFGGGTLDLSLVQLPESREKTRGLIQRLLRGNAGQHSAKVIWPLAWTKHPRMEGILRQAYYREPNSEVKGHIVRVAVSLMSDISEELLQDALTSADAEVKAVADKIMRDRAKAGGVPVKA